MDEDEIVEGEQTPEVTEAEVETPPPTFTKEQFDLAVQEAAEKAAQETELRLLREREPEPVKPDSFDDLREALYNDAENGPKKLAEFIKREVAQGVAMAVPQAVEATTARQVVDSAPQRYGLTPEETKAYYDDLSSATPAGLPSLVKLGIPDKLAKAAAYDRLANVKTPLKSDRGGGENPGAKSAVQAQIDAYNALNESMGIPVRLTAED